MVILPNPFRILGAYFARRRVFYLIFLPRFCLGKDFSGVWLKIVSAALLKLFVEIVGEVCGVIFVGIVKETAQKFFVFIGSEGFFKLLGMQFVGGGVKRIGGMSMPSGGGAFNHKI